MITFITDSDVKEAIKYLVSGKTGDQLPYTDENGSLNHKLMGAAWAALHEGYRGKKYAGPNKDKAISRLTSVYKSEKMDTPSESFAVTGGDFVQEALAKDDSFDSICCKVSRAINARIMAGVDMDLDDDGPQDAIDGKYAYVMDLFPSDAVYSMEGNLFQIGYTIDADGDVQLDAQPTAVEMSYTPKPAPAADSNSDESFAESCDPLQESSYDAAKGELTVTIIKPGISKNNRFYGADMLRRSHQIFEGAKMFADHATDKEVKDRPEGSVNNWVANVTRTWVEADGTVKGSAVVIDPSFKTKLETLKTHGLLPQMGVSIRAVGEASDGEVGGKKVKIIESLLAARSVDFVTFAGAGGQVEDLR